MKIISKSRRMGKTTEIIKIAAENNSYIICPTHNDCIQIANRAREMGLDIPFPLTIDEFRNERWNAHGIKSFCVDDADKIIQMMAKGVPVTAISVNEDNANA